MLLLIEVTETQVQVLRKYFDRNTWSVGHNFLKCIQIVCKCKLNCSNKRRLTANSQKLLLPPTTAFTLFCVTSNSLELPLFVRFNETFFDKEIDTNTTHQC